MEHHNFATRVHISWCTAPVWSPGGSTLVWRGGGTLMYGRAPVVTLSGRDSAHLHEGGPLVGNELAELGSTLGSVLVHAAGLHVQHHLGAPGHKLGQQPAAALVGRQRALLPVCANEGDVVSRGRGQLICAKWRRTQQEASIGLSSKLSSIMRVLLGRSSRGHLPPYKFLFRVVEVEV